MRRFQEKAARLSYWGAEVQAVSRMSVLTHCGKISVAESQPGLCGKDTEGTVLNRHFVEQVKLAKSCVTLSCWALRGKALVQGSCFILRLVQRRELQLILSERHSLRVREPCCSSACSGLSLSLSLARSLSLSLSVYIYIYSLYIYIYNMCVSLSLSLFGSLFLSRSLPPSLPPCVAKRHS